MRLQRALQCRYSCWPTARCPRSVPPVKSPYRQHNRPCLESKDAMLKGKMNKLKLAAIAIIALIAVIVVFQNTQPVETQLLFLTLTLPNAALLFGTLIIGFAIGVLTAGHIVSSAK